MQAFTEKKIHNHAEADDKNYRVIVKAGDEVIVNVDHELSRLRVDQVGVNLFVGLTLLKIGVARTL